MNTRWNWKVAEADMSQQTENTDTMNYTDTHAGKYV